MTRDHFEREVGPDGALCVGAPETVATKIAATVQALGLSRFDLKYSNGRLSHEACLSSIALYGTEVVPRVRALLAACALRFASPAPRTGEEAAIAHDDDLDAYMHLAMCNRGILMTPFHNMALMCPDTTRADVDRHTAAFREVVGALYP